jgi:hypothetical protein
MVQENHQYGDCAQAIELRKMLHAIFVMVSGWTRASIMLCNAVGIAYAPLHALFFSDDCCHEAVSD